MEVKVTYVLDGEIGSVAVVGDTYETAHDEARKLMPSGAQSLSIRVDREQ